MLAVSLIGCGGQVVTDLDCTGEGEASCERSSGCEWVFSANPSLFPERCALGPRDLNGDGLLLGSECQSDQDCSFGEVCATYFPSPHDGEDLVYPHYRLCAEPRPH